MILLDILDRICLGWCGASLTPGWLAVGYIMAPVSRADSAQSRPLRLPVVLGKRLWGNAPGNGDDETVDPERVNGRRADETEGKSTLSGSVGRGGRCPGALPPASELIPCGDLDGPWSRRSGRATASRNELAPSDRPIFCQDDLQHPPGTEVPRAIGVAAQ